MRDPQRTAAQGEGSDALAFVFAGLMAGIVLLPSTRLLDLKLAAALLAGATLALSWALGRGTTAWMALGRDAWRWSALAVALAALLLRGAGRAEAGFGNAGYLGAFLALSWPLWLGRPWALVLMGAALLASGSRAALLAVGVQALVLAWKQPAQRRRILFTLLTLAGAAAIAWGREGLLRPTLRLEVWRQTWDAAVQLPWTGHGRLPFALAMEGRWQGALATALAQGSQYVEHPHQLLLGIFYHGGLLALALFGIALFYGQRALARQGLWLGFLGLLVHAQFDRFFFEAALLGPPLLLLACEARPWRWLAALLVPALIYGAVEPLWASRQAVRPTDFAQAKLAAGPNDPAHWDQQGTALAAKGAFHEAAGAFREALRLEPTSGRAQNLGNSLFAQGLFKEAEAAYRDAVRLDPRSADAHFSLGYALYRLNRIRDAVASLDAALKLQPGHAEAATLKRQILR